MINLAFWDICASWGSSIYFKKLYYPDSLQVLLMLIDNIIVNIVNIMHIISITIA